MRHQAGRDFPQQLQWWEVGVQQMKGMQRIRSFQLLLSIPSLLPSPSLLLPLHYQLLLLLPVWSSPSQQMNQAGRPPRDLQALPSLCLTGCPACH